MQTGSRTIVGIYTDLSDAKRATDELRSLGISSVRLVENDQDVTFKGTAERQGASSDIHSSHVEHKKTGIGAFFSRLFGFDDEKPSWSLNRDSEAYFQDAYNKKHHLVIVEDCSDVTVCREVITRFGGIVEDQGSQYYESERFRDRDLAGTSSDVSRGSTVAGASSVAFDRDTDLSSQRLDRDQNLSTSRMDMDQSLSSSTRDRDELFGDSRRDLDRDSSLSGRADLNRDVNLSSNRLDNKLDTNLDTNLDSERVMELREEQLDIHTERMQTGEVQLRKEIITENRSVDIPVSHEEIVVERRPLEGAAREGSLDAADLGEEKEIRIPVSEEFVHIDKKVVPREEVRVSKEKVTDTKTVSEDIRREEARLDSDGRVNIKDRSSGKIPPLDSTRDRDNIQPGV